MAKIILKKSSVAGKVPLTSDLSLGEVAVNTADGSLYTLSATSTILKLNKSLSFLPGDVTYLPVASNTIEYRGDNLFLRAGYSLESDSIAFVTTGLNNFNVTKIVPLTVNGVFKVYACTTAGLYDSTNGIKWNKVSTEVFINFAYETGTGRYYGLVTGGASSKYSTDFVTWTAGTYAGTYHTQVYPIAYGLELFTITGGILQISSNNGTTYNSLGTAACNGAILVDTYIIEYSSTGIKYSNVLDNPNSLISTGVSFDSALNTGFTYADNDSVIKYTNSSTTAYTSTDGINYSAVNIVNSGNINKVIKAKVTYYIATDAGLLSSTDGVTFTAGTSSAVTGTVSYANVLHWGGVAYGNNLYLITPYISETASTHYATSTDRVTWTLRALPAAIQVVDNPIFSNGKFCVVSRNSAAAYTSTDGVNWTTVTTPGVVEGVELCGTVIIAVKYSSNTAFRSTDGGSTWTTVTLPGATTGGWCNVMYNGTRVVVTSYNDRLSAYSDNLGVTWTAGGALPTNPGSNWVKGTASANTFIVSRSSSEAGSPIQAYTSSSDGGVTWVSRTYPTNEWIFRPSYGNGYFITPLGGTNSYYSSTDGIIWSKGTLPAVITTYHSTSFANGLHFVAQDSANSIIYSAGTPTTWGAASNAAFAVISDPNISGGKVGYGNGLYIIPTYGNSQAASVSYITSVDRSTWTTRSFPSAIDPVEAPIYSSGKWCVVTYTSTLPFYTSVDGITWTSVTRPVALTIRCVVLAGANTLVALVAGSATALISTNGGTTWVSKTLPVSADWSNVMYDGSRVVGTSYDNKSVYSTDNGVTWTLGGAIPSTYTNYSRGTASASTFIVIQNSTKSGAAINRYVRSIDGGVTWLEGSFPTSKLLYTIEYGNGYFVTGIGGSNPQSYYYSADGINWQEGLTNNPLSSSFASLVTTSFANGFHFIEDYAGIASDICSTDNPSAWTTPRTTAAKISALVVKDVLITSGLTLIATTTGIFSTASDVPTSSSTFTSRSAVTTFTKLAYLNGVYFAFGGANGIYSSTDGITWTQRLATVVVNSIIYQGTLYTASTTTGIYTSTDGITWTQRLSTVSVNSVEYLNNSIYVAATTTGIYTSTNGSTYTQKLASVSVNDSIYSNLTYVASTTTGIYTSTDASTWTKKSSVASATIADLVKFKDVIILNNGEYFLPYFTLSLPASTPKLGSTHVPYICIK